MPYPIGNEELLLVMVKVIPLRNAFGSSLASFELSIKILGSLFYCVIPIRSNYDCNRNIYT
nr:MAG TPA: hypothetical protein [Caudoviricetes sp.]